jgi:hypothetical protein
MTSLEQRFPRYRQLLKLYPSGYRRDYEAQMLQTLADMLDDPERSRTAVWFSTILDLPISITRQQISSTAAAMTTTPDYLKHYALTGAWMVAPFFLLVLLNGLSGQLLRHTIFWQTNALYAWLILLPGLAALLNLVAWARWVLQNHRDSKLSTWRAMADIRRGWPALAVVVIGVSIIGFTYGHDSVHCLTGNPIRELHNAHQTLQCLQRS